MLRFSLIVTLLCSCIIRSDASDSLFVKAYHRLVHQAAVSVSKSDYKNAVSLYDSAFQTVKYPFTADVKNALYANVFSSHPNEQKIVQLLTMLQNRGICVHDSYKSKEKYVSYLSSVAEENCKKVINPLARKAIEIAIVEDQKPRDSSYNLYKEVYHPSMMGEIQRVDRINFAIVDSIYALAENADVPIDAYIGFQSANSCGTILLHNAGRGRTNKFTLDKLARKGILDARSVAMHWDECLERGFAKATSNGYSTNNPSCSSFLQYGSFSTILTFHGVLIKVPDKECLISLKNNRQKLFLQSVIEEAKIRAFAFYNFKDGFNFPGMTISSLPAADVARMEGELKKKYKIIKYAGKADFDFNRGY